LIIVLDINNFSFFNIEYGSEIGDSLIIQISKDINTIKQKYKNNILIARNSDEFLIFIENIGNEELINITNDMKYFFNKTYTINNFKLILNCNFGIEIYPKDEKNIEKLLNFAYIALKEAKNEGINRYKFYNNELFIQIKSKKEAIALIEEALKNNEFILFYQPQIETKSQKIIGAESLLRIKKDNKIIQPYKFINEIEKSDYIYEIDKIILNNPNCYLKSKFL
jgi:diguanylate cyclase (GGDEF)-like protein